MSVLADPTHQTASLRQAFGVAASRRRRLIVGLVIALAVLSLLSLAIGPARLSIGEFLLAIVGNDAVSTIILREIRLPRLILSLSVGGAMGLAGAAAQAITRNPLADPGVFGAPQAAAFGAVIVLYSGTSNAFSVWLPIAAILGAGLSLFMIMTLVGRRRDVTVLLLAGIALGSLCGAGISLVLSLSSNPFAVTEIVFWLLGSFSDRSFVHVLISLPFIVPACALLLRCGPAYRLLALGEDTARSLGVGVRFTSFVTACGIAIAVGAGTAVAGAIGFVGLVSPHLVRPACGGDPQATLWPSCLAGAILTTGADVLVRLIPSTSEIRVGVVTAMIGAPFFLYLILTERAAFGARKS
ncbi:MAG: transporter permease [Hyphomicrobiales bacterium]|nr:transporter permease [Hyphomicrobiales bacterium]